MADRANIKGFAFEYMTNGRAVVLGDPGPWACAGQTGGRVYLRVNDELGARPRGARAAAAARARRWRCEDLDAEGVLDVQELLGHYAEELRATEPARRGAAHPATSPPSREQHFIMSIPQQGTDGSVCFHGVGQLAVSSWPVTRRATRR